MHEKWNRLESDWFFDNKRNLSICSKGTLRVWKNFWERNKFQERLR